MMTLMPGSGTGTAAGDIGPALLAFASGSIADPPRTTKDRGRRRRTGTRSDGKLFRKGEGIAGDGPDARERAGEAREILPGQLGAPQAAPGRSCALVKGLPQGRQHRLRHTSRATTKRTPVLRFRPGPRCAPPAARIAGGCREPPWFPRTRPWSTVRARTSAARAGLRDRSRHHRP